MPEKGPPVYLDYDQAALDAAYDQAAYAPNREQLIKRRIRDSELARLRIGEPERLAYGPTEIERVDIYRDEREATPIFVFIHGGAWRSGRSKDFATPAEMFLAVGAHYVVPDFAWVQDVGGSLMVLADQVRRAVAWVYDNAELLGSDRNQIYIGGQSSGGHLAAVALTTDWPRDFGLPVDIIKGGMCISGMYDLTPVRLSARNSYVAFDDATVAALSPMRHLDRLRAPVIVAYGTCETPEFQRQNREFAVAVEAAGKPVQLLVGEQYNHQCARPRAGTRPKWRRSPPSRRRMVLTSAPSSSTCSPRTRSMPRSPRSSSTPGASMCWSTINRGIDGRAVAHVEAERRSASAGRANSRGGRLGRRAIYGRERSLVPAPYRRALAVMIVASTSPPA
jgi:arylformamidase